MTLINDGPGSGTGTFPSGKDAHPVAAVVAPEATADGYAVRIKAILNKSVEGIFEAARVVCAASDQLGSGEYLRLAELTGLSVSTLNKLKTIHERSARFADVMEGLPTTWTNIYELAKLDESQFTSLREASKLRPDLTADEIKQIVRRSLAGNSSTAIPALPKQSNLTEGHRRLPVEIMVPKSLPEEAVATILTKITEALKDQPVHVDYREDKGTVQERTRRALVPALQAKLKECLAAELGSSPEMSATDRETINNAAWQFHYKKHKGNFPYPPTDPLSVQHPEHLYSVNRFKNPAAFFTHLRAEKFVTPYSPLSQFAEFGEARCVRHALDFSSAVSPKVRRTNREHLQLMVNQGPPHSSIAQRYLNVIAGREAL
jgi:hypothetical protein